MTTPEPTGPYQERITRLTDVPVVNGKHTYRCNKCDETDRGHDRDTRHLKWREKHWAECWGLSPD